MPNYLYANPLTGEIKEVFQGMNEKHEYSENGVQFIREFTKPQASFDSKIDCMNSRDFVEKTGRKKGSVGNLFDASKEASLKRIEKIGKDPIKEKYFQEYSKKRKGKKHSEEIKAATNNLNFTI